MKPILLIVLAILYAVWPYDLLADLVPGWGWLDDAALLYFAWYVYSRWRKGASSGQRAEHRGGTGGNRSSAGPQHTLKDPYEILGVTAQDGAEEITRAYRRLAARYHPDKVQHLGEEFQALAEQRFKEIQAAYDELKKRGKV